MSEIHDELYEALANRRRRRLLFSLLEETRRVEPVLSFDPPPDTAAEADRIEDEHVHLPKLDDYGFVEWSPESGCVERGPRFSEVEAVLERLKGYHERVPPSQ